MIQKSRTRASFWQKLLLGTSLALLFLVAVAAEKPAEEDCCEDEGCRIVFDPPRVDTPIPLGDNDVVKLWLECDGERRDAEFEIVIAGNKIDRLETKVWKSLVPCEGKTPPCVNVWIKKLEELSERDKRSTVTAVIVASEAPQTWAAAAASYVLIVLEGTNSLDMLAAAGVGTASLTIEAEYRDEKDQLHKTRASLPLKYDVVPILEEYLESAGEASKSHFKEIDLAE